MRQPLLPGKRFILKMKIETTDFDVSPVERLRGFYGLRMSYGFHGINLLGVWLF